MVTSPRFKHLNPYHSATDAFNVQVQQFNKVPSKKQRIMDALMGKWV
ncbi:hypothetical protein [Hydromonas duriensis]|nr:hypothetical protein [Hydromonas duriensis]